jgi:nucleoside-diphosphate-sugar epimerase
VPLHSIHDDRPTSAVRRVLITGIDGFTGRYLENELKAAGWEVFGLGLSASYGDGDHYRPVGLNDPDALEAWVRVVCPHAVVHLAGIAFVGHDDADAFYQVNLLGTRRLLQALARLPVRPDCVLLASSANVYGSAANGMIDETCPVQPANDYAVSKLAMEWMARLWQDQLPIMIARPFNYTGVGQAESFLIPKIVAHFRRRAERIELGNLDVWRDFSDVRTVAQIYRRLIERPVRGEVVNICSGKLYSLREVLAMAERITGHHIEVAVNPAFVRTNEVRSLCGNPARLLALTGPLAFVPFEDTLRWMLTVDDKCAIPPT